MKILLICSDLYPEMGGSFKAITDTQEMLENEHKYQTRLVYYRDLIGTKKLDLIFLIKNFDIIHYFGGWNFFHIKVMFYSIIYKKNFIISPMGIFEDWSLTQKKIKKKIALYFYQTFFLNRANTIHVTSDREKKNLQKITINKNIRVIPHCIRDVNIVNKTIFKNHKKKAIFFSRLHKKKGIIELINAWVNINNKEWELHIYGPDFDDIKAKIQKITKNNKSITLFEPVFEENEKKNILLDYDLSILPTRSENFGYAILESLQFGLPMLTTNKTPWNNIKDENAGWIIDSSLLKLEDTLREILLLQKKDFEEKSKNAIKLSRNYSFNNLKDKYFLLYEEVNKTEKNSFNNLQK